MRGRTTQKLLAFATAAVSLWLVVGVRLFFFEAAPQLAGAVHDPRNTLIKGNSIGSKTDNFVGAARQSSADADIIKADWRTFEQPRFGRCTKVDPDQDFVQEMLLDPQTIGTEDGPQYERRVALVIGNGDYRNPDELPKLANPVNDARSVTRALSALGFTVYSGADLTEQQTTRCLDDFYKDVEGANVAMLYYAGHGLADAEGVNLLLPINASFADEARTQLANALHVDEILTEMRKRAQSSFLFLDACRNSLGRGLEAIRPIQSVEVSDSDEAQDRAAISLSSSDHILINGDENLGGFYYVYAAAPGQTASDGSGIHSPFTQAFLNHVNTPGQLVQGLVISITRDLVRAGHRQTPFSDFTSGEEFYFNGTIAKREVASRIFEHINQAQAFRADFRRLSDIAAVLKGLPATWSDDQRWSEFYRASRRELYHAIRSRNVRLDGHDGAVVRASFSTDGQRIVTASKDGTASIWDADTGIVLKNLRGHGGAVNSAAFDHNGMRIITSSQDKSARVWNVETGELIITLEGHQDAVLDAVFSPDGKLALTASEDNTAKIWEISSGNVLLTLEEYGHAVTSVAFAKNGRIAITGFDQRLYSESIDIKSVKLWNAESGKLVREFESKDEPEVHSIAVSPRDDLVAIAHGGIIKVWNIDTGEIAHTFSPSRVGYFNTVAFSHDGKRLVAAGSDSEIRVWNLNSGQLIDSFRGFGGSLESAAFSPDGRSIVAGSDDSTGILWHFENAVHMIDAESYGASFSPSGDRIVTASEETIEIRDARSFEVINELKNPVGFLWNLEFSPDGKRVAGAFTDGDVFVWNTDSTGEVLLFDTDATSVSFAPTKAELITPSFDGVRIWNVQTGTLQRTLETYTLDDTRTFYGVLDAVYSPDGKQILVGLEGNSDQTGSSAATFDASSLQVLQTFNGHLDGVRSVAYSSDGTLLVTGSFDGSAIMWDAFSGNKIKSFDGHQSGVFSVALSPNDSMLLTGSLDGTARLWDAKSGLLLKVFDTGLSAVTKVDFEPSGKTFLTAGDDKFIAIWNVGLYGPDLLAKANTLLTDELRAEVERERIRYWEVDEAALQ